MTKIINAVFLDRSTFSKEINLPKPEGITNYQVYQSTIQDDDFIYERCKDANIVITNKVIFSKNLLQRLPKLKLIQVTGTGTNNIDTQACQELNITLYNIAGYAVKSVPEHTFMLMLNAMRAGSHYHQSVVNFDESRSKWQESGCFCLMDQPLYDLEEKTLGIIGVGTIGKRVAKIAKAFDMKVLYAEHQGKEPRNDKYANFDSVLEHSDIISLHCPLTEQTKHLINANTISKMKKKPLIINVARGGVVDSRAMAEAIKNEHIFGYASDVFEIEPMTSNDPLLKLARHPRVFFTPHNAWGSLVAQSSLWNILCDQVIDFIQNHHS